jgi:hypothetical protein
MPWKVKSEYPICKARCSDSRSSRGTCTKSESVTSADQDPFGSKKFRCAQ